MPYMSKSEYEILNMYFQKDPNWKHETVKQAADQLGMPYRKIYKWGYHKKVKEIKSRL